MSCDRALPLLYELVDGEIGRDGAVWLAGHLAVCPACAALLSRLREAEEFFRRETPAAAPPDLAARIVAAAGAERASAVATSTAPARSAASISVIVVALAAAALVFAPIAGTSVASWVAPLRELARLRIDTVLSTLLQRAAGAWRAMAAVVPASPPGGWGPAAIAAVALQLAGSAWLLWRGGRAGDEEEI
jgi:hypothetical protein